MYFTYLIPVFDDGDVSILSFNAKNIKHATDLIISHWARKIGDLPYAGDLEDLKASLSDYNIYLGDFIEVNEFIDK